MLRKHIVGQPGTVNTFLIGRRIRVTSGKKRLNIPNQAHIIRGLAEADRKRRRALARRAGVAVVGCAAVAAIVLLAFRSPAAQQPPTPVSTVDSNARACVLTDPNDAALPTVDAGLQQAAQANGHLNIQHYPIPTAATDARSLLNGLIGGRCTVVVGVGQQADQAIEAYASDGQTPSVKLIAVGGGSTASSGVAVLPSSGLTSDAVAKLVEGDLP
jgi:hypothetical protein